jgi:hypothetical protein
VKIKTYHAINRMSLTTPAAWAPTVRTALHHAVGQLSNDRARGDNE